MRRRYAAESVGTFAIVFFGCGAITTGGSPLTVNLVFGLVVAASVYAVGHVSAAHCNPAVSVAFAVVGRFPWRYVGPYVAAQLAGAFAASTLHALLFGDLASAAAYGATLPSVDPFRCAGVEAVLTFFLMLVIASVATDRRVDGAVPGLAIGAAVTACGLFGGPLTGCSMNPARSLAPAAFAGGRTLTEFWPYLVGPLAGAVLGALAYEAIRGGDEHGQGAPNDLEMARERVVASG